MTTLASILFVVLASIAILHGYWGFDGSWPAQTSSALAQTVVGTAVMPSSRACFIAASAIAATAIWPLFLVHAIATPWPAWLTLLGGGFFVVVFLGRGLAGYHPAWRDTHRLEPFAHYDRFFYSPLCLILGAAYMVLLLAGFRS